MKNSKLELLFVGLAITVLLAILATLPVNVFSATTNQTNVTVEITTVCEITVAPTNLTWFNINPGSEGVLKTLTIRNTGSKNVSNIYAYVDTITSEPVNPIPIGAAQNYSSGGVLVLNTSEGAFYYVGRLEWNITRPQGTGTTNCDGTWSTWGYYRNATKGEYLWCMVNGSSGTCNDTTAKVYIETDADTGIPSTRDPTIGGTVTSAFKDWGVYTFTGGPLNGHCVALYTDCTKMFIYEYDKRSNPYFGSCSGASYIRQDALTPSNEFPVTLEVWVPRGIPAGWLASSWLTIEGSCG